MVIGLSDPPAPRDGGSADPSASHHTIVVFALLLRIALPTAAYAMAGHSDIFFTPDTLSYLAPAQSLVARGAFERGSLPEVFRTPGYPLLLTIGLLAGHLVLVTLLIQAAIGTFTVWCVMRTASLLHGHPAIVSRCGWLVACEPLLLVCGVRLLADTLLTAIVALAILLIVTWMRRPTTRLAIAVGVTLAAAAYVKPIAYYLAPPLLAWLWLEGRRRRHSDPIVVTGRQFAAALLTLVILLGAWHVRNGLRAGYWGFSILTARAVYVGVGATVSAARDGRPFGDIRRQRFDEAGVGTSLESYHVREMYAQGLRDLRAAPLTWLRVHATGMLLTLFDPGSLEYLRLFDRYPAISPVTRMTNQGLPATIAVIARTHPIVVWCSLTLEVVLLAYLTLAVRGAWRGRRAGGPELRLLVLIAAYFLLLSGGVFGTARFRAPMMPAIVLMAGYAWTRTAQTSPQAGVVTRQHAAELREYTDAT